MRESSQLFIGLPYLKLWLVPSDVGVILTCVDYYLTAQRFMGGLQIL